MLLPNNIGEYEILNKKTYLPYKDKLFDLFNSFSQTTDKLKKNYTQKNLEFDKFKEISLIIYKNNIVAFSSILNRDYWPKNIVRIFNRMWRNKNLSWNNPTFGILSKLMYNHQIEYCKKHNYDFVFLSTEKTPRHFQRWLKQANEYDGGWYFCDEKKRVCNGPDHQCVQHIIYKNISNTTESFPL